MKVAKICSGETGGGGEEGREEGMRATQPASDNGLSFDRSLLLKKTTTTITTTTTATIIAAARSRNLRLVLLKRMQTRARIFEFAHLAYCYYCCCCNASKGERVSCIEIFPIKRSTSFELEKEKRETWLAR